MNYPDTTEDVDMILRHVARQFPDQFAQALLPPGTVVSAATWLDTQVTARQRRLDRALDVMADGKRRREHTEWQMEMAGDVPFRIFEYHTRLASVLAAETPPSARVPPIRSSLVLLSGRDRPWPPEGEYRTSPEDAPFSGVTFRIDAVYQQTVAELFARGSPLWLIFTPLAVDANAEAMGRVVAALRAEVPSKRERNELVAALLVMADTDKRRRGLRQVIVPLLNEEKVMESWVYKQGEESGIEKGRAEGHLEAARNAVVLFYEARFGAMPVELRARVEATTSAALATRWCEMVARGTKEEVDAALAER